MDDSQNIIKRFRDMKREIKFRGKCSHCDAWAYGNLVDYGQDEAPEIHGFDPYKEGKEEWREITVDRWTLSQYAGVKDKNGREIYEGDILRGDYYPYHDDGEDNYLGIVFYDDEEYLWQVMKFVTAKSERYGISNFINGAFYDVDFSQMEVIGNVWDSKGLFRNSDEEVMKWFNG